jgi:hypothetical protein
VVAADNGQEPPKLPPPRAGQGPIHIAVEAGLVGLVALVGEAREQADDLLFERRALLTSVQAHICGGMLPASTRRGVRGRHAIEGRPSRAIAQIDNAARGDGESLLCGSPSQC